MVRAANMKQAASEKQLKEARGKVRAPRASSHTQSSRPAPPAPESAGLSPPGGTPACARGWRGWADHGPGRRGRGV